MYVPAGPPKGTTSPSNNPPPSEPGLPPVAATVPGYESIARWAMFAPAGTPAAITTRLNQEIVKVLTRPDVKEKLLQSGVEALGSRFRLDEAGRVDGKHGGRTDRDQAVGHLRRRATPRRRSATVLSHGEEPHVIIGV